MALFEGAKNTKDLIIRFSAYIAGLAGLLVCFNAVPVSAASFYFSPASGNKSLGQTFTVTVYASSKDKAANAFQGTVNFPEDKLQVTSLSKSGSSLSMWIQEPSFSNGNGTVQFEGIVLNPGYTGNAAKVLTITFKVKAVGTAALNFTSASILANDGLGTNILEGLGTATYNLNSAPTGNEAGSSTSGAATAGAPLAPEIKSTTHPAPEVWYNSNAPQIYWSVPSDVTGVTYAFTKDFNTDPGVTSKVIAAAKNYTNVRDGEWYFHVRLGNKKGWSGTSHRKFRVDTTPPENLKVTFVKTERPEDPQPQLYAASTDSLSGIDHYDLVLGDVVIPNIKPGDISEGKPYKLPTQEPGTHNITVKVYDAAGNNAVSAAEFTVAALQPPTITEYPDKLFEEDAMTVKGKTYPNSEVSVYSQRDEGESIIQTTHSDNLGVFSFTAAEKVKRGIYKIWATVKDERGAVSGPSSKAVVPVSPRALRILGERTLTFLTYAAQFAGLLALIIILIEYMHKKYKSFRQRIAEDVKVTKGKVEGVFGKIDQNDKGLIEMLERTRLSRPLTSEEEEVLSRLRMESSAGPEIDKDFVPLEEDLKK
jgi:hypothetical protein